MAAAHSSARSEWLLVNLLLSIERGGVVADALESNTKVYLPRDFVGRLQLYDNVCGNCSCKSYDCSLYCIAGYSGSRVECE